MSIVCLLCWYDKVASAYESCTAACVANISQFVRSALGYAEEDIFVLGNGVVVRSSQGVGDFVYNRVSNRILPSRGESGRLRPVPFVSLTFTTPSGTKTDLSDWVGEVRSASLPFSLTAVQLVKVWFAARGLSTIPLGTVVHCTTNTGEELTQMV